MVARLGTLLWVFSRLSSFSVARGDQVTVKFEPWFYVLCSCLGARSILHGVDPLSYFSFQPVLHDWCNKGRGMCYPVCGVVHIKEPLLLIGKSSPCGSSGFPLSLSEWSFTICPTPYNRKIKCVECIIK